MRLSGINGETFELKVLGYQFPELETAEYDSDWLRILIAAETPQGRRWSATDPSILTYELRELADWLARLGSTEPCAPELDFTEPNLSFQVIREGASEQVLRVFFELELRPGWAARATAPEEDLWLDFPIEPGMLGAAATSLREQLARYPERGVQRGGPTTG
jgi:hypothetical protein